MRFQGIPTNITQDTKVGRKWWPPDQKSKPMPELRGYYGRTDIAFKREPDIYPSSSLSNSGEAEVPIQAGPLSLLSGNDHHRPSRWGRKKKNSNLPFPSTHPKSLRRVPRLTFWQRVFSLGIAILVAASMLGCLLTLLGERLEETANSIAKSRTTGRQTMMQLQNKNDSHHFRRKLASFGDNSKLEIRSDSSTPRPSNGLFSSLRHSVTVISKLMRLFYASGLGTLTTFVLPQGSFVVKLNPSAISLRKALRKPASEQSQDPIQQGIQNIYQELLLGKVHSPLQVSGQDTRASTSTISISEERVSGHHRKASLIANNQAPSYLWRQSNQKSERGNNPESHNDLLHSNALSVIGNIEIVSSPSKTDPSLASTLDTSHGNAKQFTNPAIPISQQSSQPPGLQTRTHTNGVDQDANARVPDGLQVWELETGKSLCRIQNIGRLSDGTVVLPKWMKAHSEYLHARCGVRGALYAVENARFHGEFNVDSKMVFGSKKSPCQVDLSNGDRDLFGTTAPRNHMPHFVSDILLPLVASEVLLSPVRKQLVSSFLHWSTGLRTELTRYPRRTLLRPAMLVFEETLNRPPTEWVPRLAHFFEHPGLGFKLISAGMERPTKNEKEKGLVLLAFRSLLTTNFNMHEPFGLFGAHGSNIVLSNNGITRNPAWMMSEMARIPCRVRVTVLTRKGPRALLKLKDLEKRVKSCASQEQMSIDFRVVDFESMSFDEQVHTMQNTNVLVATHGAGNANLLFMRPGAAVIEVFPFSYKAGPFDSFARIFGLAYDSVMSAPQTDVFKECMNRHETNRTIKEMAFKRWDKAVAEEKSHPWVHKLEFEKEFGEPGKSQGMTTRSCARLQELEFNIEEVARDVVASGRSQCLAAKQMNWAMAANRFDAMRMNMKG